MRLQQPLPVAPGQTFKVDRFQPEDALGIASLYLSVYGPEYPFDTYYIPERLQEENAQGRIHSVVARTPGGDIVGHGALYQSSPPFKGMLEIGQFVVLPDYRKTTAAFRVTQYLAGPLVEQVRPAAIFGEAVCHHQATQKVARIANAQDCALELSLMPGETYAREGHGAGRASCLLSVRSYQDQRRVLYPPADLLDMTRHVLADPTRWERVVETTQAAPPADRLSELQVSHYAFAQVSRANLSGTGADYAARLDQWLAESAALGMRVEQAFINLAEPWMGQAVAHLQERGFFCCGLAPRWLDDDALLLERLRDEPNFAGLSLYSPMAQWLGEWVQGEWRRTGRLAP